MHELLLLLLDWKAPSADTFWLDALHWKGNEALLAPWKNVARNKEGWHVMVQIETMQTLTKLSGLHFCRPLPVEMSEECLAWPWALPIPTLTFKWVKLRPVCSQAVMLDPSLLHPRCSRLWNLHNQRTLLRLPRTLLHLRFPFRDLYQAR